MLSFFCEKIRNLLKNIRIVTYYVATFQHSGKLEECNMLSSVQAYRQTFFLNFMEHQRHCEPTTNQIRHVELCTSIVLDVAHHPTVSWYVYYS